MAKKSTDQRSGRKPLTYLEEGHGYVRLQNEGLSISDIASRVPKNEYHIQQCIDLWNERQRRQAQVKKMLSYLTKIEKNIQGLKKSLQEWEE